MNPLVNLDPFHLEKISLGLYALSALAHLIPALFVYPRVAARKNAGTAEQYARSAGAWSRAAVAAGAGATAVSLLVIYLVPWPPREGKRGSPWQAPYIIGIAAILFVLHYVTSYAKALDPTQTAMEEGDLDTLLRRWKSDDPQLCYPIEDGWPHDLPRLARRHALYSCLWAAVSALGMLLMVLAVRPAFTGQYLALGASWLSALAAQVPV